MGPRLTSVLGLSVMSLISVQMAIAVQPSGQCCKKHPSTNMLSAKAFAEHSASFRKAAESAWHDAQNGDAPYETGFAIDKDGTPGKVQLSILAPVNAATHLDIASSPFAIGSLHVHNKFGKPTPSPEDIKAAESRGELVYVESRMGLYVVNPDGSVDHLFNRLDWFKKTCVN